MSNEVQSTEELYREMVYDKIDKTALSVIKACLYPKGTMRPSAKEITQFEYFRQTCTEEIDEENFDQNDMTE